MASSNSNQISVQNNTNQSQSKIEISQLNNMRVKDIFEMWNIQIAKNEKSFKSLVNSVKKADLNLIDDCNQVLA